MAEHFRRLNAKADKRAIEEQIKEKRARLRAKRQRKRELAAALALKKEQAPEPPIDQDAN